MNVTLISWTRQPVETIHAMAQNMQGNIITDLEEVTGRNEAIETVMELEKTNIGGPLEAVDFIFQVEGVPRALTHQMVRTRIGAMYSQESLRFVAKEGEQFKYDIGPSINEDDHRLMVYMSAMREIQTAYEKLIKAGASTQDARGILPINIMTNIGVKYNLKTLMGVAEVRLCTQSQEHWQSVIRQMKQEIYSKVHPVLSGLLKPYCERHGKCGFKSIFDRPCPRREQIESGSNDQEVER